jgi:hypothetical protein
VPAVVPDADDERPNHDLGFPFMLALEAKALLEMGAVDDGSSDSAGSTCFVSVWLPCGASLCRCLDVDDGNVAGTTGVSLLDCRDSYHFCRLLGISISVGMRKDGASRAREGAKRRSHKQ